MVTFSRLAGTVAVLACNWSSFAGAQAAQDRRERVMVIPLLLCGSQMQWHAAAYLDQRVWVGLDTLRYRRISPEDFEHNAGGLVSDACEAWGYNQDSLRTYSAGDASAIARLLHARALLSVRALVGVKGVVAEVGVYVRSEPLISEHFSSSPHRNAESALDELLPRIHALLASAGVLPTP